MTHEIVASYIKYLKKMLLPPTLRASHDATKIQHEHDYSWIKYDNLCLIPAYLPIAVTALCLYLAEGIP